MPSSRALIGGSACLLLSLLLGLTSVDLVTFLLPGSSRSGMRGSWDPTKLQWIALVCVLGSVVCGINARVILFNQASVQRSLAGEWGAWASPLWWTPILLGLLVFYPLPYFNHHIDKFLLCLGMAVSWNLWLLLHPDSLRWWLQTRAAAWMRTALVNVLLVLLLGEAAVRLADPLLEQGGLFEASADTPGGGIPFQVTDSNGMKTNSRGFRDRERSLVRTVAALRILAVGDSFTWGSGALYDETFLALVERNLQPSAPGTEVINLGLVGYQPEEYQALLQSHGLAYQPDLVLVNFFVGNDFMPAQGEPMIVAGHRHRVHVNGNWFHDHLSWDHWYLSHDLRYVVLLAQAKWREMLGVTDLGMFRPSSGGQQSPASFQGWSPRYLQMIQGMGDQYLRRDTPAFLERWEATRNVLGEIDTLLRTRSIPWVLVLLPAEEQVDRDLQRLYIRTRTGEPEDYDFDKPQRLLRDWALARGVQLIDLAPAFSLHVKQRRLYVDNDVHWNGEGNKLAADVILKELQPVLATVRPRVNAS
ncbi:MAG TPA: SGNH/GDSL hydrolase family protein [Nitrospira sp.]|nr:SGNH/GDSL hydrolase family protein [Nitrospira sp.]